MSSTVQADLLNAMARAQAASAESTAAQSLAASDHIGARNHRLVLAPNTSSGGAVAAMTDSNADIEPAIITNRFTENGFTVDRTTMAFTKFDSNSAPQHYWASTTNGSTFTTGMLSPQYPDTRTSDPMLAENPYVSSGFFPKRTYVTGTSYNVNGSSTGHDALMVWYRDNFTSDTWHSQIVDQALNPYFFDKPSVWVSWEQGSIGYVYIVAVLVRFGDQNNPTTHTLYVYRGVDGGSGNLNFSLVNFSITGGSEIFSPIITEGDGAVWLSWLDTSSRHLRVARSTDFGTTFVQQPDLQIGIPFTASLCDTRTPIADCVRASTTIMARPGLAPENNTLGVVWHQYETYPGNRVDVYFDAFNMDTLSWMNSSPVHVGDQPANDNADQWNPALDPDANGNYMITWFDNRNDPTHEFYRVYATKLYSWGARVDPSDTLVYNSAAAADIANIPTIPPGSSDRYIGDYQDLWEWYGTFHGGTIYVTGTEDAYVSQITP